MNKPRQVPAPDTPNCRAKRRPQSPSTPGPREPSTPDEAGTSPKPQSRTRGPGCFSPQTGKPNSTTGLGGQTTSRYREPPRALPSVALSCWAQALPCRPSLHPPSPACSARSSPASQAAPSRGAVRPGSPAEPASAVRNSCLVRLRQARRLDGRLLNDRATAAFTPSPRSNYLGNGGHRPHSLALIEFQYLPRAALT